MRLLLCLIAFDFAESFNQGLFLVRQRRFDEALPHLEEAARLRPADFNAQYLRGSALVELARREDALEAWRKALALQPGNLKLLQAMSVEYSKGRYFHDAARMADAALKRNPAEANLYFLSIKAHQDAGGAVAAMQVAERAAARFPESARAQFEYGFHLQKLGRVEEGVARFEKAMALDPNYEEPLFFYGDLMLKQGRAGAAVDPLRRAIAIRRDYTPARVTLARALLQLEKPADAEAELAEAVRMDPRHPQPHLLLSQLFFRRGDEARAKQAKDLSLRLRRERPELLEAVQSRPFPVR